MTTTQIIIDDDLADWYDELSEDKQNVIDHRVMLAHKQATGEDMSEDNIDDPEAIKLVGEILRRAYWNSTTEKLLKSGLLEVTGVDVITGEVQTKITKDGMEVLEDARNEEDS